MRDLLKVLAAGAKHRRTVAECEGVVGEVGCGKLTKVTIELPDGTINHYESEQLICLIDEGDGVRFIGSYTPAFLYHVVGSLGEHLSRHLNGD